MQEDNLVVLNGHDMLLGKGGYGSPVTERCDRDPFAAVLWTIIPDGEGGCRPAQPRTSRA